MVFDVKAERAKRLAADMATELGVDVIVIRELSDAAGDANILVTCTPAHRWFLGRAHVAAGAFVAAVGGWVETTTLQKCYQIPDEATMESVVLQPKRLRLVG